MSEWSKEPPRTGYYWYRAASDPSDVIGVCYIDMDEEPPVMWTNDGNESPCHPFHHSDGTLEWWTSEIHKPPMSPTPPGATNG